MNETTCTFAESQEGQNDTFMERNTRTLVGQGDKVGVKGSRSSRPERHLSPRYQNSKVPYGNRNAWCETR
jgi:hypothetical protein